MIELLQHTAHYYPLVLLVLAMVTLFARGHRHLALPLGAILLFMGYRLYRQEHRHFMAAVGHGETAKVRKYLSWYFSGNYTSCTGITPLLAASMNNHTETARLLIAEGANVQAHDSEGRTPLDWARHHNNEELVEILRRHGAKETTNATA